MGDLRRKRTVWELAILVLGVNVWISFLLIPIVHQEPQRMLAPGLLAIAPLAALLAGLILRHGVLLSAVFPLSLVLPVIAEPDLVGVNIYSGWTFALVTVGFAAYMLGSSWVVSWLRAPSAPEGGKDLADATAGRSKWQRRWRVYIALAAVAGLFPAVLIHALFLRPAAFASLQRYYPERAPAAAVLFGVLALGLWLALFYNYFVVPLRAHIRGDRQLQARVIGLRSRLRTQRPTVQFYAFVLAALVLMAALFLYL